MNSATGGGPTPDLLSHAEAAAILGVDVITIANLVRRGELVPVRRRVPRQLRREQVEALAVARWQAPDTRSSYFVDTAAAAVILGVTRARVVQLIRKGFLPVVDTGLRYPVRLFRRPQLEVIAQARRRRWHAVS